MCGSSILKNVHFSVIKGLTVPQPAATQHIWRTPKEEHDEVLTMKLLTQKVKSKWSCTVMPNAAQFSFRRSFFNFNFYGWSIRFWCYYTEYCKLYKDNLSHAFFQKVVLRRSKSNRIRGLFQENEKKERQVKRARIKMRNSTQGSKPELHINVWPWHPHFLMLCLSFRDALQTWSERSSSRSQQNTPLLTVVKLFKAQRTPAS